MRKNDIVIIVCGGRNYKNKALVRSTLDRFHAERGIALLVHGAAGNLKMVGTAWPYLPNSPSYWRLLEGADLLAEEWAIYNGVPFWPYKITREEWATIGKRAGPLRNQRMLDERRPQVCIAFKGGAGTADMTRRARESGIEVIEVGDGG